MKWFLIYLLIGLIFARYIEKDVRDVLIKKYSDERNIVSETILDIVISPTGTFLIYIINILLWIIQLPRYLIKRRKLKC